MAFGTEIKRLREDANISVKKIADKIGVNPDRWRKWEEKDLTPRLEDAQLIESFFGMEISKVGNLQSIKKFLIVPRGSSKNESTVQEPEPEFKKVSSLSDIPNSHLLDVIAALVRQNEKVLDTNRMLAEKVTQIPVSSDIETQKSVDAMLQGLREFVLKVAVGTRYKSQEEARAAYRKELVDVQRGKKVAKGIQSS